MNIILLKEKLMPQELYRLLTEFPQYKLAVAKNDDIRNLTPEQCTHIEIIYGGKLHEEELKLVPQLRWIHVPHPFLEAICVEPIRQQSNILISTTKEENIEQIGEFAMSGILAFAKNLFRWHDATKEELAKHETVWKEGMWRTRDRTLLQVGLGLIGSEIARRAKQLGFHVVGLQDPPSFHPHCDKVLSMRELHGVLHTADIVSLAWLRDFQSAVWFKRNEMELLKQDAILLIFGKGAVVDLDDLARAEVTSKLRGMMLDARFAEPIPADSPLRHLKNVLITPEVGSYPKAKEGEAFRMFLYNMRQFLHGNFSDMKNLVGSTALPLSEMLINED